MVGPFSPKDVQNQEQWLRETLEETHRFDREDGKRPGRPPEPPVRWGAALVFLLGLLAYWILRSR